MKFGSSDSQNQRKFSAKNVFLLNGLLPNFTPTKVGAIFRLIVDKTSELFVIFLACLHVNQSYREPNSY